jgi:Ca2+-binding RTX toxin-like protein
MSGWNLTTGWDRITGGNNVSDYVVVRPTWHQGIDQIFGGMGTQPDTVWLQSDGTGGSFVFNSGQNFRLSQFEIIRADSSQPISVTISENSEFPLDLPDALAGTSERVLFFIAATGQVTVNMAAVSRYGLNFAGLATSIERAFIYGTQKSDTVTGGGGGTSAWLGAGDDQFVGGGGFNVADGGAGNDRLIGGQSADSLSGGAGADSLAGGAGNDVLDGRGGAVGDDADTLEGGAGADTLISGTSGQDRFVISSLDHLSTASIGGAAPRRAEVDQIHFLTAGDLIDFSAVSGLTFIGSGAFVANGSAQLRFGDFSYGADGLAPSLILDVNGDTTPDRVLAFVLEADFALVETAPKSRLLRAVGGETVRGTPGADDLVGGSLGDVLLGESGADTLKGMAGKDTLSGGDANDLLLGGLGNDTANGGRGDDTFEGGAGNDTYSDNEGADLYLGGDGDDIAFLGAASGRADGGAGADTLRSGAGADSLFGGHGDDHLIGGEGANTLEGGAGNDRMEGGTGVDVFRFASTDHLGGANYASSIEIIYGLTGGDRLDLSGIAGVVFLGEAVFSASGLLQARMGRPSNSPFDAVLFDVDGDGNADRAIFLLPPAGSSVRLVGAFEETAPGSRVLEFRTSQTLSGSAAADDLVGGNFADSITGLGGADTLRGAGGADWLDGGADADLLLGGLGNDLASGGAGNDTFDGGDGNDTFQDPQGNDLFLGGDGDDAWHSPTRVDAMRADGGAGNDSIFGGDGADSLRGGIGNDSLIGGNGADTLLGDDGSDALHGWDGANTLFGGNGNDSATGGTGNDTFDGGAGDDHFVSTHGNDVFLAGDGADTWAADQVLVALSGVGGGGNDLFTSGGGDDTLSGDAGSDTLNSGHGADSLLGGDGDDVLTSTFGNDTLFGAEGADTLRSGEMNDNLSGGNGNDWLESGFGIDVADGGLGDDTLRSNGASFFLGGSGNDRLINTGIFAQIFDGGDGNDRMESGTGADSLLGGSGSDTLVSGGGADTLDGGAGDDLLDTRGAAGAGSRLLGGAGADSFFGDGGADVFDGGDGNDFFRAGDGNDTFIAGLGADMFEGGSGDDILLVSDLVRSSGSLFDGGLGYDLVRLVNSRGVLAGNVTGFERLEFDRTTAHQLTLMNMPGMSMDGLRLGDLADRIDLQRVLVPVSLQAGGGNDTVIGSATTRDVLHGDGGADRLFGVGGDDLLHGGEGDDTLDGGTGADSISGGDGHDRMLGGEGMDTLSTSAGTDTISGGGGADLLLLNAAELDAADLVSGGSGVDEARLSFMTLSEGVAINPRLSGVETLVIETGIAGEAHSLRLANDEAGSILGPMTVRLTGNRAMNVDASSTRVGAGYIMNDHGGDATLAGGAAADTINGAGGANVFRGFGGADRINLSIGQDTVDGGAGDDIIFIAGEEFDVDLISGGSGFDTLVFTSGVFLPPTDLARITLIERLVLANGVNEVIFGSTDRIGQIRGGTEADVVDLTFGRVGTLVESGDGQDMIYGTPSADTIDAGKGEDFVLGNGGNDRLLVSDLDAGDAINGGVGVDTLVITQSAIIGEGDMAGVFGIEVIEINAGGQIALPDFLAAGQTLTVRSNPSSSEALVVDGRMVGATGQLLLVGGMGGDTLLGGLANDTISGMSGANLIIGGAGADSINAANGSHRLRYEAATDGSRDIAGGGGTLAMADKIVGFASDDRIEIAIDGFLGIAPSLGVSSIALGGAVNLATAAVIQIAAGNTVADFGNLAAINTAFGGRIVAGNGIGEAAFVIASGTTSGSAALYYLRDGNDNAVIDGPDSLHLLAFFSGGGVPLVSDFVFF